MKNKINLLCDNIKCLGKIKKGALYVRAKIWLFRDRILLKVKQKNKFSISDKLRFFVIGTEDLGNLGDHHIALSILEFLKKNYPEAEIYEVPTRIYYKKRKELIALIDTNDIIIMTGGGNFGNVYETAQDMRRDVIRFWHENLKIVMPVTIFYDKNKAGEKCLEKDRKAFAKENNIVICTRERKSYEIAQKCFSCQSILTPDIVLSSGYKASDKGDGVLLCLRNDLESTLDFRDSQILKNVLNDRYDKIINYDTQLKYDIPVDKRDEEIKKCIDLFSSIALVVTDRLHGMIFSVITGTPCIVLSNYNYKIEGCYEWVKQLEYITFCDDIKKFKGVVENMEKCGKYQYSPEMLEKEFEKILEVIEYYRKGFER